MHTYNGVVTILGQPHFFGIFVFCVSVKVKLSAYCKV